MRKAIAVALATGALGSSCPTTDQTVNWYFDLIYAARVATVGTGTQRGDLHAIMLTTPTVGTGALTPAVFDSTLAGYINDPTNACGTCAYTFFLAAFSLKNNLLGPCGLDISSNPWYQVNSEASCVSSDCQWVLFDAITAFNACAGNGLDLVTALPPTRCTTAEFITFSIAHNPLSAIAQCTFDDTALISAADIGNCVGPSYVADKASLGCKSCFDPLMTGIQAVSVHCGFEGVFNMGVCSGFIYGSYDAFGTCSGGLNFALVPEAHCSADQMRVIAAMRPYANAMSCAFIIGPAADCFEYYNSIVIALNELEGETTVCSGYLVYLAEEFRSHKTTLAICQTTPFATACTDLIDDVYGDLYNAEVSIGMKMDTTNTMCSSTQWNAMAASDKSYIPFVRCAMKSTSPADVLDCIEGDSLLTNALAAPCASCFAQLAIEAYVARQSDDSGIVEVLCADPYSAGCLLAMAKPLAIFTACSGFESEVISNSQCSVSALAAAASNSAGIVEVMSLVINSVTVTEAIYTYSKLTSGLSSTEFPCQYCLSDLIGNLFNLSAVNKAICVADLTSWGCYMAMGPTLDTFWKCSQGWSSTVATSIPLPVYVAPR